MRLCVCVFCARCDAQRIMAHETKQNKTEVCVLRCEQNKNNDKIRHKRITFRVRKENVYVDDGSSRCALLVILSLPSCFLLHWT